MRPLVDFLIVGSQKCGTTSAISNLSDHPDVERNHGRGMKKHLKEVHFFNSNWDQGVEWYRNKFDYLKPIVGEKTPTYITRTEFQDRIAEVVPDVKLIEIVREPTERLRSEWSMLRRLGWPETRWNHPDLNEINRDSFASFVDVVLKTKPSKWEANHPFNRGLYAPQIKSLMKRFPRENIKIFVTEELSMSPVYQYSSMLNFVGADPSKVDMTLYSRHNVSPPGYQLNANDNDREAIVALRKVYASSIEELFDLLGRKIPSWIVSDR
jgi:hypothetical protein